MVEKYADLCICLLLAVLLGVAVSSVADGLLAMLAFGSVALTYFIGRYGRYGREPRASSAATKLREFHTVFGAHMEEKPTLPPAKVRRLREILIREEFKEYVAASKAGDLIEIADGLADLMYVVYGAALSHGIPLDEVFDEVHRSNMSKVGPGGEVVVREDGKILKPETFFRPDIAAILEAA